VLREVVASVGLDADAVAEEANSGRPLKTLAAEHTECVEQYGVFGVPTFIEDEQAAFVRFMDRGNVDDLEKMLGLLQWSALNEFKRPRIPR
jgi:2-hydroxychromene-2-carboxylate isomerase